mgnify:CR=1 FL=1
MKKICKNSFRAVHGACVTVVLASAVTSAQAAPDTQGCSIVLSPGAELSKTAWPAAGGTICLLPGDYAAGLYVEGRKGKPIVIRGADTDPNNWPNLTSGVTFRNSDDITLQRVNVSNAGNFGAVVVDKGSSNITLDSIRAKNSLNGVVFGSGLGPAGINNIIKNSEVGTAIDYVGIAVVNGSGNGLQPTAAMPFATQILNNIVSGNGGHGIDVDRSRFVKIEGNKVATNGYAPFTLTGEPPGGYSGIHLYDKENYLKPEDRRCGDHQVRFNYVWDTRTVPKGTDGNGIQIDNFCDYNVVAFNVVWNNEGAGIAIYNAAHNQVYSNTVAFNTRQKTRVQDFDPKTNGIGEIVLSACVVAATCAEGRSQAGRTHDNRVFDNLMWSNVEGNPALNLHETAATQNNILGPNLHWVDGQWPVAIVGNIVVDKSTALTSEDLVEQPIVKNPSSPLNNGLQLTQKPSKNGQDLSVHSGITDLLGQQAGMGYSYFGAYFTK